MKYIIICSLLIISGLNTALANLPKPDHIVILILENHGYSQIIESPAAPFINSLARNSKSALLTKCHSIEHPSQPNYLDLFSGSNQGVTNDDLPTGIPFTTDNMAVALISAGYSFATFSEDLPATGSLDFSSGAYARRHNPASFWQGDGLNQIPQETNRPFTDFPTDFTKLPTVCYVVPNNDNNMHNGSDPEKIAIGDEWTRTRMNDYIEWAKDNNGLFILTFDEDDYAGDNRIVAIITGSSVIGGEYDESYNLFSILRTVEDMYNLKHSGAASTASSINVFRSDPNSVQYYSVSQDLKIFPIPAKVFIEISGLNTDGDYLEVFNCMGENVFKTDLILSGTESQFIDVSDFPAGQYILKSSNARGIFIISR